MTRNYRKGKHEKRCYCCTFCRAVFYEGRKRITFRCRLYDYERIGKNKLCDSWGLQAKVMKVQPFI